MIINHLENGVTECISENVIVRVHPGKLSKEERQAVIEKAAQRFLKAIVESEMKKGQVV